MTELSPKRIAEIFQQAAAEADPFYRFHQMPHSGQNGMMMSHQVSSSECDTAKAVQRVLRAIAGCYEKIAAEEGP